MRQHAPGFPTVSIVLRIVFSIVRHCSCAGGFSLAVARPCIVIPVAFPIADRLYLVCSPLPSELECTGKARLENKRQVESVTARLVARHSAAATTARLPRRAFRH